MNNPVLILISIKVGQDSLVSIATRYGVEGPGTNTIVEEVFYILQTVPGVHPVEWVSSSLSGRKTADAWPSQSTSPTLKVKECVQCSYTSNTPLGFHGLF